MDPNTLNLDQDPDRGLYFQFWERKEKKIFLRITIFFKKVWWYIFFQSIRTKWHLKKFVLSWVSELWIYVLNLTSFVYILSYICRCGSRSVFRIRIQKAREYGSNTDPDPQHCSQPEVTNISARRAAPEQCTIINIKLTYLFTLFLSSVNQPNFVKHKAITHTV